MHFFPLGVRAGSPQEALRGGAAWMGPAWPTLDTSTQGRLPPSTLRLSETVHAGFRLLRWLPGEPLTIFTCSHMTSLWTGAGVVGRGGTPGSSDALWALETLTGGRSCREAPGGGPGFRSTSLGEEHAKGRGAPGVGTPIHSLTRSFHQTQKVLRGEPGGGES